MRVINIYRFSIKKHVTSVTQNFSIKREPQSVSSIASARNSTISNIYNVTKIDKFYFLIYNKQIYSSNIYNKQILIFI